MEKIKKIVLLVSTIIIVAIALFYFVLFLTA